MFDVGVDTPLGDVLPLLRLAVDGVEVDGLDVQVAARLVEQFSEAERLLAALRVLATAALKDAALWRREGFRSAAAWTASKTGTAVGPAIATMEMAERLAQLPFLAAAFRAGRVSEAQAREIAEVASEVPEAEEQLVEAAGKLTLKGLQEECRRVEAAAIVDEDDRYRRVHRSRRVRSWVDRHGTGRMSFRGTPDELARLMGEIDRRCDEMVVEAIRGGWFASCSRRGTPPNPRGIVPRCDRRRGLENDHRNTFGRTGVTKLEDLARLCRWHHYQKTFLGYTYRGGPGTWQWIPPENRDEDLSGLRRIISSARRC